MRVAIAVAARLGIFTSPKASIFARFLRARRRLGQATSERRTLFMAAKKAGKAPAKTPATVTLKHLAAKIAEDHEIAKKQSEAILGDAVGLIVKHLKGG